LKWVGSARCADRTSQRDVPTLVTGCPAGNRTQTSGVRDRRTAGYATGPKAWGDELMEYLMNAMM
jgi:hypothetical protein